MLGVGGVSGGVGLPVADGSVPDLSVGLTGEQWVSEADDGLHNLGKALGIGPGFCRLSAAPCRVGTLSQLRQLTDDVGEGTQPHTAIRGRPI